MAGLLAAALFLGVCARAAEAPQRVEGRVDGARAEASVTRSPDGASSEMSVVLRRGKGSRLAYLQNAPGGQIVFASTPGAAGFVDFFGDGAPSLVYRLTVPALGQSTLLVLRYQRPRFVQAGAFPEGELRREDGRWLVVSRERPLGRLFRLSCGSSGVAVGEAFRTELYVWKDGRFVSVSAERPEFFRRQLAADEAALSAAEKGGDKDLGRSLDAALTLYFDDESLGRRQDGWKRLEKALRPRRGLAGSCLSAARKDLRATLKIPDAW